MDKAYLVASKFAKYLYSQSIEEIISNQRQYCSNLYDNKGTAWLVL